MKFILSTVLMINSKTRTTKNRQNKWLVLSFYPISITKDKSFVSVNSWIKSGCLETFFMSFFCLILLREGYTVKFFFQGISWNTVSGSFHETWNTFMKYFYFSIQHSEAVVQMCSLKKLFLEISQNSQENICARASFLIGCLKSFIIAK